MKMLALDALLALFGVVAGCLAVRFVAPPVIQATSRAVQRAVALSAAVLLVPDDRVGSRGRSGWGATAVAGYGWLIAAVAGLVLRGVDRALSVAASACRNVHPVLVGAALLVALAVLAFAV